MVFLDDYAAKVANLAVQKKEDPVESPDGITICGAFKLVARPNPSSCLFRISQVFDHAALVSSKKQTKRVYSSDHRPPRPLHSGKKIKMIMQEYVMMFLLLMYRKMLT